MNKEQYEQADIIFANNLLFDNLYKDYSLKGRMVTCIREWATKPDVCIVTSAPIADMVRGSQQNVFLEEVSVVELPPQSVAWTCKPVTMYLTYRSHVGC